MGEQKIRGDQFLTKLLSTHCTLVFLSLFAHIFVSKAKTETNIVSVENFFKTVKNCHAIKKIRASKASEFYRIRPVSEFLPSVRNDYDNWPVDSDLQTNHSW